MGNCDCHDEASNIDQRSVLVALLIINGFMFVAEFVCGLVADSTGLIADSLDMLADATVYGIALRAVGRTSATKISAARWSGIFQITLACGLLIDIVRRLLFGSDPDSWFMWSVGLVALAANVICLAILSKHRKGEVHMRASWIFSKNDVLANVGVIIAGVLVYALGNRWPDLAIGLLVAAVVLRGGVQILRDASSEASQTPGSIGSES